MYGYIYITINTKNNRAYIGQHKSDKYDRAYYGSGTVLQRAIKKYGKKHFINEVIEWCDSKEELDECEKKWISYYREMPDVDLYNIADGGEGGNTFIGKSPEEREAFRQKMTDINRERCNTPEFKAAISKATSARYKDPEERKRHAEKVKKAWADPELRKRQSEAAKARYAGVERDCSFNHKPCAFEINDEVIEFESVKALRQFLIDKYNYNPARQTFMRLLEEGKQGIPFKPLFKNKFKKLIGMKIYKIDKKETC